MPVAILQNLTVVVTRPYTAVLLGNLGARIIKIESPHHGRVSVEPFFHFPAESAFL